MKSYIKLVLFNFLCLAIIIAFVRSKILCDIASIDINTIYNFSTSERGFYFGLVILIFIFGFYQWKCKNGMSESFEVILADDRSEGMLRLNLRDFFAFIELFQVNDLDPNNTFGNLVCHRADENIIIQNTIRHLLRNLHYLVNINKKDNFYSRFLVAKVGSHLYQDEIRPQRRRNYDEMVRDNIGKQYTFMPKKVEDMYYPRPNLDSKHQEPIPTTINVHNYYTFVNTQINLLALKMIIESAQENNPANFGLLVRPTEHMAFEQEFMIPIRAIVNSMAQIINTQTFGEYMTQQMKLR